MPDDVRMKGFSRRTPVDSAFQWIDDTVQQARTNADNGGADQTWRESIKAVDAAGQVLAESIQSGVSVPNFRRSMMDGYAVLSSSVVGADSFNPIELEVVGEVLPGQRCEFPIHSGAAARVMTGAEVPENADAVVPVEQVEADGTTVKVLTPIAGKKNIANIGEDIQQGETVFRQGRILRPQDIGVIASIGVASVWVRRKPRVRILTTGNELLPAGSIPQGVQIVDSNGPMLAALIERDGGIVINPGIVPDDEISILEALQSEADVILVSGGSSTGLEDYAPGLLANHGDLPIHGIAMRPSSPAGMGRMNSSVVFLLPGNPVSCLCAYDFFAGRCIRQLGGRSSQWPYRSQILPLAHKLVSTIGRTDYARVRIVNDRVEPLAISGASMLSSTTRADGFVVVDQDSEGFSADKEVEVFLYDL